jgi:hypothetical protein
MKEIARFTCGNHGIVLRHEEGRFQSWITHQFNTNLDTHSGGYYWGHYYNESCDAIDDFFERCNSLKQSERKDWTMDIEEEAHA